MPRRGRSSPMRSPSPPARYVVKKLIVVVMLEFVCVIYFVTLSQNDLRSYSRSNVPAKAPAPPSQPMPYQAAPQGPGLMKQMAATAGGVAIGSAVVSVYS